MTGFKAPSDDWLGEEVEKQKRKDAAEMGEAVIVVEETAEFGIASSGRTVEDSEGHPVNVEPSSLTPETHRALGLDQSQQAFLAAWDLIDQGIAWLEAVGYRPETKEKARNVGEDLRHVIELIDAWEVSQ